MAKSEVKLLFWIDWKLGLIEIHSRSANCDIKEGWLFLHALLILFNSSVLKYRNLDA